jgi:hypothetical protein
MQTVGSDGEAGGLRYRDEGPDLLQRDIHD